MFIMLQLMQEYICFLFRRESPWKVDGESTGVSAKLKLLEQELVNLERIGKNDLSKVPSLMRKQAKRYQALAGKIDDLCRRMVLTNSYITAFVLRNHIMCHISFIPFTVLETITCEQTCKSCSSYVQHRIICSLMMKSYVMPYV